MKFGRGVSMALMLAVLVCGAGEVLAQEWKLKNQKACEANGDGLRCNFYGDMGAQAGRVFIENLKPSAVTIEWYEFHSACGWPGSNTQSDKNLSVAGSTTAAWRLLDPGYGVTCREVFLSCTYAGSKTKCSDVVRATMKSYVGNQQ